jgi:hypothetical protein
MIAKHRSCNTRLATKSIESSSLTLECIDNIKCGDSLALGMLLVRKENPYLGVGDRVTKYVVQELLENGASLYECEK